MADWFSSLPAFATGESDLAARGSPAAVVFVWAAWDPVCRVLDKKLCSVQSDYPALQFFAMNLDQEQNWPLAIKWGVQDTRALVCLIGGDFHELVVIQDLDAPAKAELADRNKLVGEQKKTK